MDEEQQIHLRISTEKIDACPVCCKTVNADSGEAVRMELGGELLFFGHRECCEVLSAFVRRIREVNE